MRLVGGRLALDFVNTADWSAGGRVVHEKLEVPEDLDVWTEAVGLERVDGPTDIADLHRFRSDLRQRLLDPQAPAGELPDLRISDRDPPGLRDALLVSAYAILMDRRERARLKICAGDDCGWLFIDESRGARRQWCSMETCGNRAKARRHYARHRGAADPDG
jgi:hypothetical protein